MEPVGIEPTTRTLQVFIAYPWDMRPRTADILLRLSSQTAFQPPGALWLWRELNSRRRAFQTRALPTELHSLKLEEFVCHQVRLDLAWFLFLSSSPATSCTLLDVLSSSSNAFLVFGALNKFECKIVQTQKLRAYFDPIQLDGHNIHTALVFLCGPRQNSCLGFCT